MDNNKEIQPRIKRSPRYYGSIKEIISNKTGKVSYLSEFHLYDDHYRRSCKGCYSFEEAELFVINLQKKIHDLHNGLIDEAQMITIKEMFESLIKTGMVNNCTEYVELQKSHIRRFLAFWGGDKIIADLTPAEIEEYRR